MNRAEMKSWDPATYRNRLEKAIETEHLDFAATYMAVNELSSLIGKHPEAIRPSTILALNSILEKPTHASQTQSLFLYKAAADTLVSMLSSPFGTSMTGLICSVLKNSVGRTAHNQHRAVAEALGSLPLNIRGPNPESNEMAHGDVPCITWNMLINRFQQSIPSPPQILGRSIVCAINGAKGCVVAKLATTPELIRKEALWMQHFHERNYPLPVRFEIPRPLTVSDHFVFRLKNLPASISNRMVHPLRSEYYGIGFHAPEAYFSYPNDHRKNRRLGNGAVREILFRNAWLFGRLMSMGIVHAAPIPLFHNRTQRNRREDHGVYEWGRGGRLDRWLASCRYPNFGITGLRDFEHLKAFPESCQNLYSHIGTQLLSLFLVTGSFFRNKDPDRLGYDESHKPTDNRELFDRAFFKDLVSGIFTSYYEGFTERAFQGELPVNYDELIARMIEEMGVDRHMEEVLRVADQHEMTDALFRNFLKESGLSEKSTDHLRKGENDITVWTGPHLGGFNDRISLPELIRFLEIASALCIAGRFEHENALNPKNDLSRFHTP